MTATVAQDTQTSAESGTATSAGISHFLIRRLHSLTGILFGGYIVVHLMVNATLIEGVRHGGASSVFQVQVNKIHSLPFLLATEWAFIYLPITFHTLYGLYVTFTGQPNSIRYPFGKNWFYFVQRTAPLSSRGSLRFTCWQ